MDILYGGRVYMFLVSTVPPLVTGGGEGRHVRGCGERQVNEAFLGHEYINERARCHAAMSSEQLKSVGRIRGYRLVKWFSKIENCNEFQTDQNQNVNLRRITQYFMVFYGFLSGSCKPVCYCIIPASLLAFALQYTMGWFVYVDLILKP
jgi:hypothetical protein